MFRLSKLFIAIPLLFSLWATIAGPTITRAGPLHQDSEPAADTYSFNDLGFGEQTLYGPSETKRLQFSLPASWELTDDTAVTLDLETTVIGIGEVTQADVPPVSGLITVAFNGVPLDTLTVVSETTQSITLPIGDAAILAGRVDSRQELTITLETGVECDINQQIVLTVRASSLFELPHEVVAVPLDLTLLPRPLYQRSFLPETVTLIIPDAPSIAEIQSALTVAAGLGRMTANRLGITLQQVGALAEADYAASNLIFIGKPAGLPILTEIRLPAAVGSEGLTRRGLEAEDGIVQIAPSPWNDEMVALVISGNTDTGVIKASQAFASRQTLVNPTAKNISIVADVNSNVDQAEPPVNQSFSNLGYDTRRISQPGISSLSYDFVIPEGFEPDSEAFVDVSFAHSALIDYDQSGLVASINDEDVGSVRFSDATTSLTSTRFVIPRSAIRAGRNVLNLRASLLPRQICFDAGKLDIWMTVWPESTIHMPLAPAITESERSLSLGEYPAPFLNSPSLDTTAFVLSADDLIGWQAAVAIAADIGARINGSFINLAAAYSNDVPETLRQERDLILIGRPSGSALITELNEDLPAPYTEGSDQAINRISQVTFRTEGASVGNLQLLNAPWNRQRIVLAVLGSSDEGLNWATEALTVPDLRARLGGTFALVVDQQLFLGGTRLASLQPVTEPPPEPIAGTTVITTAEVVSDTAQLTGKYPNATPPSSGPSLLIPLGISMGVMIMIVGSVVGFMWLRGRPRSVRPQASDEKASLD